PPAGGCALFQWVVTPEAPAIHRALARQGILTRLFHDPVSLRFGLPGTEQDWARLQAAIAGTCKEAAPA
ncbi:MAG: threonine-phosphate decarboxylase, partial [Gammaproteobacteria bacterium]